MISLKLRWLSSIVLGLAVWADPGAATEGETLITQEKALAGGVTPGDTPGFPVTITVSGVFKLASNLVPPADRSGIYVVGEAVTLDLNGFALSGSSTSGTEGNVGVTGDERDLVIRNGSVHGFSKAGIYLRCQNSVIDRMRIYDNRKGVYVDPRGAAVRITNSTIAFNESSGVECGAACHVASNNISRNGGVGVHIRSGAGMVLGNTIISNAGAGILATNGGNQPLYVGAGNNTVMNNGGDGEISGNVRPLTPNACAPEGCP